MIMLEVEGESNVYGTTAEIDRERLGTCLSLKEPFIHSQRIFAKVTIWPKLGNYKIQREKT